MKGSDVSLRHAGQEIHINLQSLLVALKVRSDVMMSSDICPAGDPEEHQTEAFNGSSRISC